MSHIRLLLTSIFLTFVGLVNAQNLGNKVPADAKFKVILNGKSFFKHVDSKDINKLFKRFSLLEKITDNKDNNNLDNLEDLGFDLNSYAYIYSTTTDSVVYAGALLPLSNKGNFEKHLIKDRKVEQINGLNTIYSADKTTRVSWDNQTIYVLSGIKMPYFFNQADVIKRYGLLEQNNSAYAVDSVQTIEPVILEDLEETEVTLSEEELTELENEVAESVEEVKEVAEEEEELYEISPPEIIEESTEFDEVYSTLEQDEYQDDYYLEYRRIQNHNDSIQNILINRWVDARMENIISGNGNLSKITLLKDNELASVEINDVDALYSQFYPKDILYSTVGLRPAFNYGFENVNGKLIVDGNKMLFNSDLEFDNEVSKSYKEIYNKKINPKFINYVDPSVLGFMSINLNTEAYIKHIPHIVSRFIGPDQPGRYNSIIDIVATVFDIALDEKAIAKVFKGDNLLLLNGVAKKQVTYTDYEYDDDYNATQVERTKTETIPDFMWMFSSDDMRVFDKILALGIKENEVINQGGIYELKEKSKAGIDPYFLMKDGIVFISNNLEKLQLIQSNKYNGKADPRYAKMLKKSPFSFVFNTKRIPAMVNELDIPVDRQFEDFLTEVSEYGDLYITSTGIKGNKMHSELGIEFPNKKGNALAFLLDLIDRLSVRALD